MPDTSTTVQLDAPPVSDEAFLADVVAGLTAEPKQLPCKYFYDQRGSQLFDRICQLDEYYLTRAELAIMRRFSGDMADRIGARCLLIELGSGSSVKTPLLLEHLQHPAGYVPVDICREHLHESAAALSEKFPRLAVMPVHADFAAAFDVPRPPQPPARHVVYFPGSTIGNFSRPAATDLFDHIAQIAGPGGGLLVGFDLKKSRYVLEAAYNDRQGVTADFNLNLLERINRDLGANFEIDAFRHRANYNPQRGRIEMHLVSNADQTVNLDHTTVRFAAGESIHTENSYKYDVPEFAAMTAAAGFRPGPAWFDDDRHFCVQLFER